MALPQIKDLKICLPEPVLNMPDYKMESGESQKPGSIKRGVDIRRSPELNIPKKDKLEKPDKSDSPPTKIVRTSIHTKADLKTAIRSLLAQPPTRPNPQVELNS